MSIYGPLGFVYKLKLKEKKAQRIVFKTELYRIIEYIKKKRKAFISMHWALRSNF